MKMVPFQLFLYGLETRYQDIRKNEMKIQETSQKKHVNDLVG